MYSIIDKVEKIQKAINIVLSENRHVFLHYDIELLEECLKELESLKVEIIKVNGVDENSKAQLIYIIKLLDVFFACSDNILQFFDDVM